MKEYITHLPVMDIKIEKTKLDDSRSRHRVKYWIYEAIVQLQLNDENVELMHSEMCVIDPVVGLSVLNPLNSSWTELVDNKFGKYPVGSYVASNLIGLRARKQTLL